jgi:hypothetical protein
VALIRVFVNLLPAHFRAGPGFGRASTELDLRGVTAGRVSQLVTHRDKADGISGELALSGIQLPGSGPWAFSKRSAGSSQHGDRDNKRITNTHRVFS